MISFFIYGHKNTLCTHKNTIEFTKQKNLSKNGDCILGVLADFDAEEVKKYSKENKKGICIIEAEGIIQKINFDINKGFSSDEEIVIRRSPFLSDRTLGIKADISAKDIDRRIVKYLLNPNNKAKVILR